jgi:DNA-binding HxlR family transcriptional regulator
MALERFDDRAGKVPADLLQMPVTLFNPHRLAIVLELYNTGSADFPQLKHDLGLTDGALASHLKVLVADGLIEVSKEKERDGSRERTGYLITARGMQTFEKMLESFKRLSQVIKHE